MTRFTIHRFDALDVDLLHRIVKRREEVFVVEQKCAYLDVDGFDPDAWHAVGRDADDVVAYARILPAGTAQPDHPSIGRVLTAAPARGRGLGRAVMEFALEEAARLFPGATIKISAQTYLLEFYASLGFHAVGEGYLEDGIPHRAMLFDPAER